MPSGSKGIRSFLCIPLPTFRFKKRKARRERPQLEEKAKADPPPTPTVNADELAEAKARIAKPEHGFAEERKRFEDEIRQSKEAREKELADKNARIQQLERKLSDAEAKNLAAQSTALRVKELTTRLEEKEKILKERTTELSAAQEFLTKVDAVSEAEVVGMIDNLNTLISSTSGALQDTWDQQDPVPGTLVEGDDSGQVRGKFGDRMFAQIAARDPVAVNLAIQISLGDFIRRVTSGWGGGETAGTLGKIYEMISTKESQTIASRWRTLTKRYTPHQEQPRDEEIMGDLARILMATQSFPEFSEAMESVGNSAGTEIRAIIEATIQLDNTIKTKIASCDMSVYIVRPGTTFSEEKMANEFGEGGKKDGGEERTVAGTMEVGLLKNGENVLRKPKVILERDLFVAEGER